MESAFRPVRVTAHQGQTSTERDDLVAVEAPLELRLNGERFLVTMRTPGADPSLALGLLFSEGVIAHAGDVAALEHWPDDPALVNRVNVILTDAAGAAVRDRPGALRHVAMTSACGLCGRVSLESLSRDGAPLAADWHVDRDVLVALPDRLRTSQPVFDRTGGLHAAALFDPDGTLLGSAEDVGRHNAVDKLVGEMLAAGRLPLHEVLLAVSGRASFEIVQKAFLAGIPLVVAVSAPSSLAVEYAEACGMTLVGFARQGTCNVYTRADRIRSRDR